MKKLALLTIILCLIPMASISSDLYEDKNIIVTIKSLSSSELELYNPLMETIDKKIEQSKQHKYNDKIKDGIQHILPVNAARYWLVFDFLALYGNGGMQHAILTFPEELIFKE